MSDTEAQYLWKIRQRTLYRSELSKLYHRKREKFFDATDGFGKFVTVVAGAAAVATLVGDQWRAGLRARLPAKLPALSPIPPLHESTPKPLRLGIRASHSLAAGVFAQHAGARHWLAARQRQGTAHSLGR